MWSKKPTPVAISPRRGVVEEERDAHVGLAGLAAQLGAAAHVSHSDGPPSIRRGRGSPRPRRSARPPARARPPRVADVDLAHAAAEVGHGEAGGEAGGAVGGQRVVRAGHVVAERRRGGGADEQAAGAGHARRERLGGLPHELEVLGRQRLGEGERAFEVGRGRRAPSARPRPSAARGRAPAARARARRATPCRRRPRPRASRRRARPARAGRAPPAAGRRRRSRARAGRTAPRSRRCRPGPRAGAWPPARTRLPGPTITSTGRIVSVPSASAAIACAPPIR